MVPESSTREIISFGDEEPDPAEYAGGKLPQAEPPLAPTYGPFKIIFFVMRASYFLSLTLA